MAMGSQGFEPTPLLAYPGFSFQNRLSNCGKSCCRQGPSHGPYIYAFWSWRGKTYPAYIGKELSEEALLTKLKKFEWQTPVLHLLLDLEARAYKRWQQEQEELLRQKEEEQRRQRQEEYERARRQQREQEMPLHYHADDFALLGLDPSADWHAVHRAYLHAASRHHPDHGGSHEVMVKINLAHERLQRRFFES
jgi:hypothetical protein